MVLTERVKSIISHTCALLYFCTVNKDTMK